MPHPRPAKALLPKREIVTEREKEADGLIARIRTAARDDGELPLFDMDGQ